MARKRDAGWCDMLMLISGPGTDLYAEAGYSLPYSLLAL